MRKKNVLIFLVVLFLRVFIANAQEPLKADAGNNKHFCFEIDWISTTLGGNPTAIGGTPPYTYSWWGDPENIYMISSSTVPNPEVDFIGENTFYVEVVDFVGNIAIDSLVITMSNQQLTFLNDPQYLQIDYYINKGDSVFLDGNVKALNPNSTFSWSSCESIVSDCTVSDGFWAKPTVSTEYYLTAKDEHNCTETFFTYFYRVFVDEVRIKDDDFECAIDIFPNPTSQILTIKILEACKDVKSSIEIFNMLGNKVYNQSLNLSSDIQINTSNFKSGVYLLVINMDKNKVTKKITIN